MSAASRPRRRRGSSWIWLQGLASGALLTLATPLALLLGALLLPGLVMLIIDRHPGKPVARAMLFAGAAVAIGPVEALWAAGFSLANALDVLSDVTSLGGAWAAAALAWLGAELAPLIAGTLYDFAWRRRDAELARRRAELEEEWGLPPAEASFSGTGEGGPPEGVGPQNGGGRGVARSGASSPSGHIDRALREGTPQPGETASRLGSGSSAAGSPSLAGSAIPPNLAGAAPRPAPAGSAAR